jgi:DNA-binding transcriptional LysR family regulator
LNIDPNKLIYLAAIIEHGSLSRAAKSLGISQPALSTSMDRLEAEVGLKLMQRGPQGIVTTRQGDILYAHARLIREELALAARELRNEEVGSGLIRIGSLPSLASKIVPMAMGRWRETHPDLELQVVENAQIDLLVGLMRRDFDFVVGFTEVFDMLDGLRQRVLFRDRLRVIASPEHPLKDRQDLTWHELVKFPWISPTSRRKHTVLEEVMRRVNDAAPVQLTICGSVSLMKSMVAGTNHLALLPAHAIQQEVSEHRLIALPFDDTVLSRDIAIFFREAYQLSQPQRDLVDCVEKVGIELCNQLAM